MIVNILFIRLNVQKTEFLLECHLEQTHYGLFSYRDRSCLVLLARTDGLYYHRNYIKYSTKRAPGKVILSMVSTAL